MLVEAGPSLASWGGAGEETRTGRGGIDGGSLERLNPGVPARCPSSLSVIAVIQFAILSFLSCGPASFGGSNPASSSLILRTLAGFGGIGGLNECRFELVRGVGCLTDKREGGSGKEVSDSGLSLDVDGRGADERYSGIVCIPVQIQLPVPARVLRRRGRESVRSTRRGRGWWGDGAGEEAAGLASE